jgi:calcineurin-like phosphoesterase family protein
MSNIFFTSDTHFDHRNLVEKFKRSDGSPARKFNSVEEMNEYIIKQWNSVVRKNDNVWHLGDVSMNPKNLKILNRLNGRKKLVAGNHDNKNALLYLDYFEDVVGVKVFKGHSFLCTHIPVHPCNLEYRWKANVHGHMHSNKVLDKNKYPDNRYINVCGEHWDYKPVEISEIDKIIERI